MSVSFPTTRQRPGAAVSSAARAHIMRHLHFVQSLEPLQGGGLGRAAFELHESLLNRGLQSALVATTSEAQADLLPSTRQYPRKGPDKAFFAPALAREASQWVGNCDVVHGHGFYVATNWLFGQEARRQRKALVYHPHGFFEPWILRRSKWKKRVAHALFETRNFASVRLWRALTGKEADQIRAQGMSAPIVVAPNGIRLEPFDNIPASHKTKARRRLLFLGRLHPKKGIDLLLQAWAKMRSHHPDWEIVVAGPDEDGHLATLREIVSRLDLHQSVSFPGAVTGAEKVALLKSADLFALTSYSEGFSVAVLEAMACRLPVLLTTPCNFPELTQEGGGWQCEANVDDVERSLRLALEATEEEREQRGAVGRKLVEERYTWAAIAGEILAACERHCR
jgi:glycosyltransferase involved in cell wall biosynthesis